MSCSARYMGSSLRSCTSIPKGSSLAPARTIPALRPYSQAQAYLKNSQDSPSRSSLSPRKPVYRAHAEVDDFDARGMSVFNSGSSSSGQEPLQTDYPNLEPDSLNVEGHCFFSEHLNGLFPSLEFPSELARRILTHNSHPAAVQGHNAGLRFIGRRTVESYLFLFLNSCPSLEPYHDVEAITSRTINTYTLGEHIGSQWGLGRILRWTPAAPAQKLASAEDREASLRSVGLYKVQGDTVAAVMGGIFYQFGGSVAHRVFHTRLLPHILLEGRPDGLPDNFHKDALNMCERMGGLQGKLLLEHATSSTSETISATS